MISFVKRSFKKRKRKNRGGFESHPSFVWSCSLSPFQANPLNSHLCVAVTRRVIAAKRRSARAHVQAHRHARGVPVDGAVRVLDASVAVAAVRVGRADLRRARQAQVAVGVDAVIVRHARGGGVGRVAGHVGRGVGVHVVRNEVGGALGSGMLIGKSSPKIEWVFREMGDLRRGMRQTGLEWWLRR